MPPKKKLSKKEKARLEAEQAEMLRIELEKEKLKKVEEQRLRKQIEREEAETRQRLEIAENQERRQQLKASMSYFSDIRSQIVAIKRDEKQQIEWEKYMRCNGLPSANCPSDLRKYIHMWKEDIKSRHRNERNWLLKTDERTLLTQDTNIPNLSRSNLRRQQGNLGDLYAGRIREVLGILAEVDEAIADETQPIGTVTDLCKLKTEIRYFLRDYLDEYTYKILSHIERDMEPDEDRPGISQHIYLSSVFNSQVWSISPDAQVNPKDQKVKTDETQHTEIDFPAIKVQITLPPSVAVTNCAFRALWLNYDHFSDYCPTYQMARRRKDPLNILLQTKKEWKKRKEILQSMLDEASQELPISDFDPTNMPDEPTTPRKIDIDKIYNDYEDELNRERRKLMALSATELGEFEVNLRKYRIMGGVFAVDHLEQPQQDKRLNANSFTRTITSPSTLARKVFHQTYKPPPPPLPGVRRLPEEIEAEMRYVETNLEKLGSVTVELPISVIWFEPPIACRWESVEETNQSEDAEKKPSPSSLAAEKPCTTRRRSDLRKLSSRSASQSLNIPLPVRCITDFDMNDTPPGLDVYGLLQEFVVPRLPEGCCVRVDTSTKYTTPKPKLLYLARHKVDTDLQLTKTKFPAPITESLVDTGIPRALYPQFNFEKILQIKRPDKADDCDEAGDKRTQSSNDAINRQVSSASSAPARYMFSQLLEDLDRLCELQMPSWNEHVQKICSNLSSPNHDNDDDGDNGNDDDDDDDDGDAGRTGGAGQLSPPLAHSPTRKLSGIVIIQGSGAKANGDNGGEDDNGEFGETESTSEYEDNEDFLSKHLIENAPDDNGQTDNRDISLPAVGKWSTRDVHDTKFNEDKLAMQFRTGRLGIYGFAMNRYCNMPYQAWELKPDFKMEGAIQFSFTASIISLDMSITAGGYCVNSFQGGTTDALNEMIGRTLSLTELQAILIQCGVDIFPDEDAFCYTEGSCEKNYVMEMHLYACMSTLGLSHNFGWSRWNLLAGSRTAVLLMRELVENKKPPNHSTLLVTPLRTAVIDCTEVSASFNPVPAQGMEFYADLYQLSQVHSLASSRSKQRTIDPVLRDNVARILMSIRPLSFC